MLHQMKIRYLTKDEEEVPNHDSEGAYFTEVETAAGKIRTRRDGPPLRHDGEDWVPVGGGGEPAAPALAVESAWGDGSPAPEDAPETP